MLLKRSSKVAISLKIIAFVLLFTLIVFLLNTYATPIQQEPWRTLSYLRTHRDVDTLFLGTSVTHRSNMPLVVDEETGLNSCNMATPAQTFMASYYLLEEVLKTNDLKHVILQVYISRFQSNPVDDSFLYDTANEMPFSLNMLAFLTNAFTVENYPNALLRCYCRRDILQTFGQSGEEPPAPVTYAAEAAPYIGKGYCYSAAQLDPRSIRFYYSESFDRDKIKPLNTLYLNKIIDLCRQRGIDLIFMTVPRIASTILKTGNYGAFHDYVQAIADENRIPFWDYVYVRPEVLRVSEDMFIDDHHANYRLAVPLSRVVGRMLRAHIEGTLDESRYLYPDFSGFEAQNRRITALSIGSLKPGDTITVRAITGGGVPAQFRFSLSGTRDGEYTVIQDWSEQNLIDLSGQPDQACWLRIEARQPGENSTVEQCLYVAVDLQK